MRRLLFTTLLSIVFIISINAQAPTPTPQPSPSNSDSISLKEYREILENERKLLEDQSEKYYTRIDSLMKWTTWAIGIVAVAALGLIGWRFGKTRRELEDLVHEQVKAQTLSLVESDLKTIRASVESEVNALRSSIQELETQVKKLKASHNQLVVWVFSGTEMNAQPETDALGAVGLENIQILTPSDDEDFMIGEPDLVIFSFDGTDEGRRRLNIIVTSLKERKPPVSLLIYTYNPEGREIRLREEEREILRDFRWYLPVNFPSTLLSQAPLLIRPKTQGS